MNKCHVGHPVPFKWRLEWFPPGHYIRLSAIDNYVDTGDVFVIVCASISAAKSANSAYLGCGGRLAATAALNEFTPEVLRIIRWNDTRGDRKTLPIGAMKNIISKMTTQTAKKLFPDFRKLADDMESGKFVSELVEDTPNHTMAIQTTENEMVATAPPNTMVALTTPAVAVVDSSIEELVEREKKQKELSESADSRVMAVGNNGALTTDMLPCFNSPVFTFNPYNSAAVSLRDQVGRAGACLELQKIQVSAMENGNAYKRREKIADAEHEIADAEYKRRQEIADAEHVGKKAKIAAETGNQEWHLKLSRLKDKYEWAVSKKNVQLAAHFEKLIKDL